jgi:hypothetical protein
MLALPFTLRTVAVLIIVVAPFTALAADEDRSEVGVVNKVENEASIAVASAARPAIVGMAVHMNDELRTGANGRMLVTFLDDTQLTLGANTSVVIDRFVYDPDNGIGRTLLRSSKGAFRYVTGRAKDLKENSLLSRRLLPISRCVAPSSGAGRSTRNMGCCCSKVKLASRTRRDG